MQLLFRILLIGLAISLIGTVWFLMIVFDRYGKHDMSISYIQWFANEPVLPNDPSALSESEPDIGWFIPENPCKVSAGNQRNYSGNRLSRCKRRAEPVMMSGECPSRLGNQMFSYATLFAISRYNNRKAWMSPSMSDYISKYFNVTSDTIEPKLFKSIKWKGMTLGGKVPDSIRKLDAKSKPYVKFGGVPQVWQYFDEIRPQILQEFRFYEHIIQNSKSELLTVKKKYFQESDSVTLVGIHIRRGDYLKRAISAKFYLPTMEFYIGAMKYFTDKYENVIFVVASNDVPWCEENFSPLTDFHINILQGAPEKDGGLDMAILAHCDHVIYGLGTFGFWAGYLNPGEVIYCSDCITPNTGWLRNKIIYNGDYGNCVLPSWVGYSRNGTESYELAKTTDGF